MDPRGVASRRQWRHLAVTALLIVGMASPCWQSPSPDPLPGSLPKTGASKNTKNPYCSVACQNGLPHTLCQYSAGISPRCKSGRTWPLNGSERAAVLHAHNLLRNRMASGGVPPFPSAANMKQMEWDSELEQIAQRWADQCSFSHDQCRDSGRFAVGQNVAIYFSSAARFPDIESRVHSWYDEIRDYTYAEGPFTFALATGHFTQVVWGDTNLVGCGRARYEDNTLPTQLLVCNYGPAGNVETEPLYRAGAPCSGCPGGRCSPTYPALCAPSGQTDVFSLEPAVPVEPLFLQPSTPHPLVAQRNNFFSTPTAPATRPATRPATTRPATTRPTTPRPVTSAPTTRRPVFTTSKTTRRPAPTTAKSVSTIKPAFTTVKFASTRKPFVSTNAISTLKPFTTAKAFAFTTPKSTPTAVRAFSTARALSSTSQPFFGNSISTSSPFTSVTAAPSTEAPDPLTACPIPRGSGPTCKEHRAAPLSAAERAIMLDFHNQKRNSLANGEVQGFGLASNMQQMFWDEELEALAQSWADKCQWGHDPCRSTERWAFKGQNLGLTYSLNWVFSASTDRVEDWFQELKLYNYTSGPFTFAPATSHFTQLSWADTFLVGCGRTRFMSEHAIPSEYLVCNYGPGGNVFGQPLYREGPPCSRCPLGSSCSVRYPALCARSEAALNGTGNELDAGPLVPLSLDEPSSPPFLAAVEVEARAPASCPRPAGPGPACTGFLSAPLSQADKEVLLATHNQYRSQIASGAVAGLDAAAAMLEMKWSEEIAEIAQKWADQCSFGYDECAKTASFQLGQNMAIWYSQDPNLFPAPEGRVTGWFNERQQYNYSSAEFRFTPTTAAFTQLAWGDTWLLGCGRSRYRPITGSVMSELLVCNYGPSGNVAGGQLYQPGTPCSACPASCSARYPALCTTGPSPPLSP